MNYTRLGQSNVLTAPIIFGGNVFGWTLSEAQSFEMLDTCLESGLNTIDTADVYSRWVSGHSGGESETVLGRYIKKRKNRDRLVLATKVGMSMGEEQKGLSKAYIIRAVEKSLQRLQTDYIDLYQSHTDDVDTPLQETLEAYAQLIRQGKIRAIGASNYGPERLQEARQLAASHDLPRYESLQPAYNLYDREDFERNLAPICRQDGISVIPYFALASGFLTGKYRRAEDAKGTARERLVSKYFDSRGMKILQALDSVSRQEGATPASIALAWLMSRPEVTAPIASATSIDQLRQLIAAIELRLDPASLNTLNDASAF